MTPLPIEEKHPLETIGVRFDFTDFLTEVSGDPVLVPTSYVQSGYYQTGYFQDGSAAEEMVAWDVAADTGVILSDASEVNGVITVLVAGGDNKRSYTVAADIRTSSGRVARQGLLLRVRGQAVSGAPVTGSPVFVTSYVQPGYYQAGYFQDTSSV